MQDIYLIYEVLMLCATYVCLSRVIDQQERIGYLINMHSSELIQEEDKRLIACVDYYFIQVSK